MRWWTFDGPDMVDNGLCLCSLHHKLFDKGVLGLADDDAVMVCSCPQNWVSVTNGRLLTTAQSAANGGWSHMR